MHTRLAQALKWAGMGKAAFHREVEARGIRGASYDSLIRYLNGDKEPSITYLTAAAEILRVRLEWLALNRGPAQDDPTLAQVSIEEYHAALLPPQRELAAWHELVDSLPLDAETATIMRDLPRSIENARDQLDVGHVRTPSGGTTWRPGPEIREAMRLELRCWVTFLSAWIDEIGLDSAAQRLMREKRQLRQRFSETLQILQPDPAAAAKRRTKRRN